MRPVDEIIQDVFKLSPEIKLKLVQDLWDDLAANPANVPVYDWQIEEVQRRVERLEKNPESGLSWEEVNRQIRERNRSGQTE